MAGASGTQSTGPMKFRIIEMRPFHKATEPGSQLIFGITVGQSKAVCAMDATTRDLTVLEKYTRKPQFIVKGLETLIINIVSPNGQAMGTITRNIALLTAPGQDGPHKLNFQLDPIVSVYRPNPTVLVISNTDRQLISNIYFGDGMVQFQISETANWVNAAIMAYGINMALTTYRKRIMESKTAALHYDDGQFDMDEFKIERPALRPLGRTNKIEMRPNQPEHRETTLFHLVGDYSVMICVKNDEILNIANMQDENISAFRFHTFMNVIYGMAPSGCLLGTVAGERIYYRGTPQKQIPDYQLQYEEPPKSDTQNLKHIFRIIKLSDKVDIGGISFENGLVSFQFNAMPVWVKALIVCYGIEKARTTYSGMIMDNLQSTEHYEKAVEMYKANESELEESDTIIARANLISTIGTSMLRGVVRCEAKKSFKLVLMDKNSNDNNILGLTEISIQSGTCKFTDEYGNYVFEATGFDAKKRTTVTVSRLGTTIGVIDFNQDESKNENCTIKILASRLEMKGTKLENIYQGVYHITADDTQISTINSTQNPWNWRLEIENQLEDDVKMLILAYAFKLASCRYKFAGALPENEGYDVRCTCTECKNHISATTWIHNIDCYDCFIIRGTSYSRKEKCIRLDLYESSGHNILLAITFQRDANRVLAAGCYSMDRKIMFKASPLDSNHNLRVTFPDGNLIGCYENGMFIDGTSGKQIMSLRPAGNYRVHTIHWYDYQTKTIMEGGKTTIHSHKNKSTILIQMMKFMTATSKMLVIAYALKLIAAGDAPFHTVDENLPLISYGEQALDQDPIHIRLQ